MKYTRSASVLCMMVVFTLAGGRIARAGTDGSPNFETFTVDTVHSSVLFRVTHMGVGPFWGRFGVINGTVLIPADRNSLKLDLEIAIDSIDTGSTKLDQHLQTEDFFHASKYPSATFKSRSARKISDGEYSVSGDLTIRGVTKEVEVNVSLAGPVDSKRGRKCGVEVEFVLKRANFGMTYGILNGMIGDQVRLIVALEAAGGQGPGRGTGRPGARPGDSGRGRGRGDPKMMMDRIKSMDKNGDGKIERSEVPQGMQRMFNRLDANGDGVADKKEIEAFQGRMGGRRD